MPDKSTLPTHGSDGSGFTDLIAKALVDKSFRDTLLSDPDSVTGDYDLSDLDKVVLAKLDKKTLEDASSKLELAPEWYVGISITIHF